MSKRRTRPTITEAQLRQLAAQGLSIVAMASQTGIPANELYTTCSVLGISPAAKRDSDTREKLLGWVDQLAGGATQADIAMKHGITPVAVCQALKRAGLPRTMRAAIKARNAGA